MTDKTTYTGSCHCGAVTFEANMTAPESAMACNCSHCSKKGFLLHFIPFDDFTLLTGEDELTQYNFNTRMIDHLFCKTCGVEAFAYGKDGDGNKMAALNLRCIDDLDVDALPVSKFNGKDA